MTKLKHYLLSLPMGSDFFFHCYVMGNDRDLVERASAKMIDEIEKQIGQVTVPLLAVTGPLLPPTVRQVRRVLTTCYPDAIKMLAEATDFHCTIWGMSRAHPDCEKLMKIH